MRHFQFLEVKFSIYLNRRVFVMEKNSEHIRSIRTDSVTRGLCYIMTVRLYILLDNICNEYARQSLQHI